MKGKRLFWNARDWANEVHWPTTDTLLWPVSPSAFRSAGGSSSKLVAMMQTAHFRPSHDLAGRARLCLRQAASRRFLRQTKVRAVFVKVSDVIAHEPFEMAFVEYDDVIEQITSATTDEALSNTILPGTLERCAEGLDSDDLHCLHNLGVEDGIAVMDQVFRRGIVRKCLSQLLGDPSAGWMSSDVEVQHTPSIVSDDEEAGEHPEGQRRHCEEVHGSDGFTMVTQKRRPSLCRFRVSWRSPHPAQHGSLRNVEAEHLQFAMNTRRSPKSDSPQPS